MPSCFFSEPRAVYQRAQAVFEGATNPIKITRDCEPSTDTKTGSRIVFFCFLQMQQVEINFKSDSDCLLEREKGVDLKTELQLSFVE